MQLHVKLRDGFSNDTVSISIDGNEVYRKSGVSTDLTVSFADAVEVPVQAAVVTLEVTVRGQKEQKKIRVQDTPYVDVWLVDGKMELQASKDEVPML